MHGSYLEIVMKMKKLMGAALIAALLGAFIAKDLATRGVLVTVIAWGGAVAVTAVIAAGAWLLAAD